MAGGQLAKGGGVAPRAGAGIEIGTAPGGRRCSCVAPRAGAGIEMVPGVYRPGADARRPPRGGGN